MINKLKQQKVQSLYQKFADCLKKTAFAGDIELGYADRTVLATDNSIYQLLPEGVLYPSSNEDLSLICSLAHTQKFQSIVLSPRGGGTGTNGQSLTTGFMVDTSRHMRNILEINVKEKWARVQSGVVKDHLNQIVKEHGLFFAPELSTSNRATIGGMVNTDASGQGSIVYGKTRHHILELTSILIDGTIWKSSAINNEQLDQICQKKGIIGNIHHVVKQAHDENIESIKHIFPKLNRNLTGYDLANIRNHNTFNLNAILCGSEGTLAMVSEIKLQLLNIPKKSALVLVFYPSFQESLQDAQTLIKAKPDSIETIDSKVFRLAKKHNIWQSVSEFFPDNINDIDGINFIEFTGEKDEDITQQIDQLKHILNQENHCIRRSGTNILKGSEKVKKIWAMRKQAVGLLGGMKGNARPIAFVEDTAVPPEKLAKFIQQFRAILDQHNLSYGMFGHVDAGVLHVRPAIDMKDPQQALLVRSITDQVAQLAKQYGGVLWGEHGKGIRSEYAPVFFDKLYPVLQTIKSAFDPFNQLNPGKIATPDDQKLLKIDAVQTRGELDRHIEKQAFKVFSHGMHCNGNGACFNYDPNSAMCPTWKVTQNRIHSPKGRSSLVREWLRLQNSTGGNVIKQIQKIRKSSPISFIPAKLINSLSKLNGKKDFSHEVYHALDQCMSCKSCAGQCPIQVNIPDLRSQFFEIYHSRYLRPIKHYIASILEPTLPYLAKISWGYNKISQLSFANYLFSRLIGLQDLPTIKSSSPLKAFQHYGAKIASVSLLNSLSKEEKKKSVILVQDAFTSFFDTSLITDLIKLLKQLNYQVFIAHFLPNGKVLHVYGYLNRFKKTAQKNANYLSSLAQTGVDLVGVDSAVTLTYRDEYKEVLGNKKVPFVHLLSEWLFNQIDYLPSLNLKSAEEFILLGHCTEVTNAPSSIKHWKQIFNTFGINLTYQSTGCCGMSGIYGHESRNVVLSKKAYNLSWKNIIEDKNMKNKIVATGFSCRCQSKRFSNTQTPHPIQILLKYINNHHTIDA